METIVSLERSVSSFLFVFIVYAIVCSTILVAGLHQCLEYYLNNRGLLVETSLFDYLW